MLVVETVVSPRDHQYAKPLMSSHVLLSMLSCTLGFANAWSYMVHKEIYCHKVSKTVINIYGKMGTT